MSLTNLVAQIYNQILAKVIQQYSKRIHHDEEEYRGSLKNYVWNYVRYDPAVPLQGIYREKSVF